MAKEHPHRSKARILFGFAEIDSGDPALVESVRCLGASVVRALQGPQPSHNAKALPNSSPNGKNKGEEKTLFDEPESGIIEQDGNDNVGDVLDAEKTATSGAPKETRAPKKAPIYEFVTDLNLHPEGKKSLKDFYNAKKPADQQGQFALVVYYLAKVLNMTGITANHIYTALQEIKQRVPKDILQICRNVKARKGWIDPSDVDNVRITTQGENFVNHELQNVES